MDHSAYFVLFIAIPLLLFFLHSFGTPLRSRDPFLKPVIRWAGRGPLCSRFRRALFVGPPPQIHPDPPFCCDRPPPFRTFCRPTPWHTTSGLPFFWPAFFPTSPPPLRTTPWSSLSLPLPLPDPTPETFFPPFTSGGPPPPPAKTSFQSGSEARSPRTPLPFFFGTCIKTGGVGPRTSRTIRPGHPRSCKPGSPLFTYKSPPSIDFFVQREFPLPLEVECFVFVLHPFWHWTFSPPLFLTLLLVTPPPPHCLLRLLAF